MVTYTIGGMVSGLAGNGLELQDDGGANLSVTSSGSFTFAANVAAGSPYDVTVLSQPSNPAQTCVVESGTGTATSNITNVEVTCSPSSISNTWTWMNGSTMVNQPIVFGTQGVPDPNNSPGYGSFTWVDNAGDFWLYMGGLYDAIWKYSAGEWTWVSGSSSVNPAVVYGTQGVASPTNTPGARGGAICWIDISGDLWLFGGGVEAGRFISEPSDLWKYSSGQWTWMGGSSAFNQAGIYGVQAVADANNLPGGRADAAAWTDASGNLWLFGGNGFDSEATGGDLNDLWKYSNGEWTWMAGSITVNQPGIYGAQGIAGSNNIPGSRSGASVSTDSSGNVWLFGGFSNLVHNFNDLWKYSGGQWTWIGGSQTGNQMGVYGVQGVSAPGNTPGARTGQLLWIDSAGSLWLFGGNGFYIYGSNTGELNDLWRFSGGQWTWVSGSNQISQPGIYGVEGVPSSTNVPGSRDGGVAWVDAQGALWLFGGFGFDSTGTKGRLNDLWKYQP